MKLRMYSDDLEYLTQLNDNCMEINESQIYVFGLK